MEWLTVVWVGLLMVAALSAASLIGVVTAHLFLGALDSRSQQRSPEVRDAHPVRH